MTGTPFDRRRTPARPDLAAEHLRGTIEARSYAAPRVMRVAEECVPLRAAPTPDTMLDTQAIFGERIAIYEDEDNWAWGQLQRDLYVGYLNPNALMRDDAAPTHRVRVPRTLAYPGLSMKLPIVMALPMGAQLDVVARHGDFAEVRNLGCVWAAHLASLDEYEPDFVAVAELFLNVPYLWGGKTALGLDCSGLVQVSLQAAGVEAPRDTDMQAAELGEPVAVGDDLAGLRRGDLIFWKGHVGIMRDERNLLHANGHHMLVASEPLAQARDRILANAKSPITAVKRLA